MVGEDLFAVVEATERRYREREPQRAETKRVLTERGSCTPTPRSA